jgi:methylglyoxal synthase
MWDKKRIALVAHTNKKPDLLEWAKYNRNVLARHELYSTATTGTMLELALGVQVNKVRSGPLGGDQQIGAKITEGDLDLLIFFWDPLETQPHASDVSALLRVAMVWNIPVACNRASADYIIASPLLNEEYERSVPQYEELSIKIDPHIPADPDRISE